MPRIAIVGLACSTFLILLSSSAVPQEPARAGADAGSGQLIFNNACRTCHTTKEGDNRLGPNLHNIIGRKAGSLPSFGYSSAMKGADFVWDKEKLSVFAGPRGNRRSHPDCLCRAAFAAVISTRRPQDICSFRTLSPPLSAPMQRPGSTGGIASPLSVERRACRSGRLPDRDDETSP